MPFPLVPVLMGAGIGLNALGQIFSQRSQNRQRNLVNSLAQGMFQNNPGQWELAVQQLLNSMGPMAVPETGGAIDPTGILAQFNTGNDGLMQFLRADPTRQLQAAGEGQFDLSKAFEDLSAFDDVMLGRSVRDLRGGYSGLGQRFGSSARATEGQLRSDFLASTAARNAGIAQSAFENARNRALAATQAGLGFQLGALQTQGQLGSEAARLLATIEQANQQNRLSNLNLNNQGFLAQLQALQLGGGLQNQRLGMNQNLLAIMQGLPPQQNAFGPIGQGITEFGQLMAILPYLQQLGKGK